MVEQLLLCKNPELHRSCSEMQCIHNLINKFVYGNVGLKIRCSKHIYAIIVYIILNI